jgi:putative zinc finger protein
MTCVDVRDRLTEHALGVLAAEEAAGVERHLEWCAGCRKEFAELQEGAAAVSLALPPADPPAGLEDRIVREVTSATGKKAANRRPHRHHAVRLLAVATFVAAAVSVASIGWGVNQLRRAEEIQRAADARNESLQEVIRELDGRPFEAKLFPSPGRQGGGSAVLVTAPRRDDLLLVEIVPPQPATGPYSVRLLDGSGSAIRSGELRPSTNGTLVLVRWFGSSLAQVKSVTVVDRKGNIVLAGSVHLYAGPD